MTDVEALTPVRNGLTFGLLRIKAHSTQSQNDKMTGVLGWCALPPPFAAGGNVVVRLKSS